MDTLSNDNTVYKLLLLLLISKHKRWYCFICDKPISAKIGLVLKDTGIKAVTLYASSLLLNLNPWFGLLSINLPIQRFSMAMVQYLLIILPFLLRSF